MKISYHWLSRFIQTDLEIEKVSEILTEIGLEVEKVEEKESIPGGLKGLVVGKVKECIQHPNADRLKLTKVDTGDEELLQIVCGAPNVREGLTVVVATVGTLLYPPNGESFKIKKGKIRGEVSEGMICAESEIGVGQDANGIIELDEKWKEGTEASEVYGISSDYMIEIGLTPNRADAMSHFGVARDLNAYLKTHNIGGDFKSLEEIYTPKSTENNSVQIKIENTEKCNRFTGVLIKNVTNTSSPEWMQKLLRTIGIEPKNALVDVTNFICHDLGQPLHAYDFSKVSGDTFFIRNSSHSKMKGLNEKDLELLNTDLIIEDETKPLCIAGVMGGESSMVTDETTEIFLESAYFEPVTVRKTSKRLAINTDSSFRFERGIDPNLTFYALKKAANLIVEFCGGEIASDFMDIYPNPIENQIIEFQVSQLNKLSGIEFDDQTIENIFSHLEIKVLEKTSSGIWKAQVPAYRVDVLRTADLIEEILRIYGLNNIPISTKLSFSLDSNGETDEKGFKRKVSDFFVNNGFYEAMNNSLSKEDYYEKFTISEKNELVKLINPLSKDLNTLRTNLELGLLENIERNYKRKINSIQLFEWGNTYKKLENGYEETEKLAVAISSSKTSFWKNEGIEKDYFYLKGVLENYMDYFFGSKVQIGYQLSENPLYEYCLEISLGKNQLGTIGSIHPKLLKHFDLNNSVFMFVLDSKKWMKVRSKKTKYEALSKFPSVVRDLAVVLDKKVSYQEIETIAYKTAGKSLKSVELFDEYTGDKISSDKKSYAISFTLEDKDKTMSDKQIEKTMQRIFGAFQKQLGAELRN